MDISSIKNWDDLISGRERLDELKKELGQREGARLILTRMGELSVVSQDELKLLRLINLIARNAHWADGELKIVFRAGPKAGRCTIFFLRVCGSFDELLFKSVVNASSDLIREHVATKPDLFSPFEVSGKTTVQELVLRAPRVASILPQMIKAEMRKKPTRVPKPPAIPHDLVPAPKTKNPSSSSQVDAKKPAEPPPQLADDDIDSGWD